MIGAEYFMELDGVIVERVVLGSKLRVGRDGFSFLIEIPSCQDEYHYGTMVTGNETGDERVYVPKLAYLQPKDDSHLVEIRIVRVVVNVASDLSADKYDKSKPEDDVALNAVFLELWNYAHEATREFTDTVRSHGQPWIEPNGLYPRVLNTVPLVDTTLSKSFGFSIGRALGSFRVVDSSGYLTPERLAAIERTMQQDGPPSVGEVLVSDAFYLAESEQANGPSQATLLAAMGVEVKTKAVLKVLAGAEKMELLELLLENPRDWSLSAHGLFAKALPTLAARDLGEDHKELSKRVQKLFTARNKVAHRGESIDTQESKIHVATAQASIQFLREMETS